VSVRGHAAVQRCTGWTGASDLDLTKEVLMRGLGLMSGLTVLLSAACLSDVGGDEPASRDAGGADDASMQDVDAGAEEARDAGASEPRDAGDAAAQRDATANEPVERFKDIYADILAPKCATSYCHVATNRAGLNMSSASLAYMRLVGVKAGELERDPYALCKESGLLRVVPGDPDASLLIQKLAPPATGVPCGKVMPENQKALPETELTRIRRWIAQGAANN
jgi:hypothetical protein